MQKIDVVLCHPVRTAIGTYDGSLKDVPAPDLGAAVIRETLKRAGLTPLPKRSSTSKAAPLPTATR